MLPSEKCILPRQTLKPGYAPGCSHHKHIKRNRTRRASYRGVAAAFVARQQNNDRLSSSAERQLSGVFHSSKTVALVVALQHNDLTEILSDGFLQTDQKGW